MYYLFYCIEQSDEVVIVILILYVIKKKETPGVSELPPNHKSKKQPKVLFKYFNSSISVTKSERGNPFYTVLHAPTHNYVGSFSYFPHILRKFCTVLNLNIDEIKQFDSAF